MADEETQQDAAAEDTGYAKRIPSVPKPDKNKFDQKVADLQEEITRLQAKMETIQGRMNELKGKSGKASGPVGEAKAQMPCFARRRTRLSTPARPCSTSVTRLRPRWML